MITGVRLQHFRSYDDVSFEVASGVNIVVGPNASGKTSLLESLLVAGRGGSYRAKDSELIQTEADWARIDVQSEDGLRTVKITKDSTDRTKKEFVVHDKSLSRLALNRTVPIVLFEPEHLQLLTGSPEKRRDYLDDLLEQTTARYATLRRQYKRTLAQRNRLLKLGPQAAGTQLFAWNIRLSQLGGQVAEVRARLIARISDGFENLYSDLAGSASSVVIAHSTTCSQQQYSSDMLHKLETNAAKDFERGFTSYGPHRDDLDILLHHRPLQDVGSRGEVRTILLALKIKELEIIEEIRSQKPLLLLDDVFSELDGARRMALTKVIKNYQTFITTTDADIVVGHFLGSCNVIPLGTKG